MKIKLVLLLLLALSYTARSQNNEEGIKSIDTLKVVLSTDINFSASSNDNRKEATSGIGTLGLKFNRGYIYGDVNFTVYSQNKDLNAEDSTDTKIFGTNLLVPQNSSSKISNFYMLLGVKTFYLKKGYPNDEPTFSLKRFGANASFRVNNTTWIKDSLSVAVTINSFHATVTYTLINATVLNSKEEIRLMLTGGLATRRIGGDIALRNNNALRTLFLGTEKLAFTGTTLGCRLEVSKFYGQMTLTSFGKKEAIAGFSGNQAIITLGLTADLTLNAKEKDLKETRLKKLENQMEELEKRQK